MRVVLICAVVGTVALGGCGNDQPEPGGVIATTGIAADITREVAGDDIEIGRLIPDGADDHVAQLSPRDRSTLDEASLIVAFGAGLEGGIDLGDAPCFEFSRHVGRLRRIGHGVVDPHTWMDPSRVAKALPSLADALAKADPRHAGGFRRRAGRFAARLRDLDREVRRGLSAVPRERRLLVSAHATLGYFGERYGFRTESILGASTGSEPGAARLARLIERVRRSGVPAVFGQRGEPSPALRRLASQTGAKLVDGLVIETLDGGQSYIDAIRLDARLIADALR